MTTTVYDIGDRRTLQVDFTDAAGTPAGPTAVTLTIREPDGTIVSKTGGELSNPQVGRYTFAYTIAKDGRHVVRWQGAGVVDTAEETEFYARRREAV
jgi:hypothetical protein